MHSSIQTAAWGDLHGNLGPEVLQDILKRYDDRLCLCLPVRIQTGESRTPVLYDPSVAAKGRRTAQNLRHLAVDEEWRPATKSLEHSTAWNRGKTYLYSVHCLNHTVCCSAIAMCGQFLEVADVVGSLSMW